MLVEWCTDCTLNVFSLDFYHIQSFNLFHPCSKTVNMLTFDKVNWHFCSNPSKVNFTFILPYSRSKPRKFYLIDDKLQQHDAYMRWFYEKELLHIFNITFPTLSTSITTTPKSERILQSFLQIGLSKLPLWPRSKWHQSLTIEFKEARGTKKTHCSPSYRYHKIYLMKMVWVDYNPHINTYYLQKIAKVVYKTVRNKVLVSPVLW